MWLCPLSRDSDRRTPDAIRQFASGTQVLGDPDSQLHTRPPGTQKNRALLQSDQTTGTKEHLTSLSRESPSSYVGQSPTTVQSKWEQVMGSRRNSRDKTNSRNHQETTLFSRQLILIKVPRTPMEAVFRISKHPLPCISQVFMWRT